MADVTILHNPACSTSKAALAQVEASGLDHEVVLYLKAPLDGTAIRDLLDKLDDEPTALVRRDPYFSTLGLTDDDVRTREQVVAVLLEHPRLLQRPVLVRGQRAIIGRPKDRVAPFLEG